MQRRWPPALATALAPLALLAMVAYVAWVRWQALTASPLPIGIDGYFYPLQLRSLLATGHLAMPASPLAFWLMAPLAAVTDPITGAKLGAAVLVPMIALPTYGVGARLGGGRGPGLLAAAVAATSAGCAFLGAEFVKNGIGLTVAMTALWLILRACERPSAARLAGAVVGAAAAILTHKMAAGLTLVVGAPAVIGAAWRSPAARLWLLGGGLAVVGGAATLGALAPRRFLSTEDLALLHHLVTRTERWDLPALVLPRLTLTFDHEARTAAVLGLLAIGALAWPRLRLAAHRPAAWAAVGLALGVGMPWLAVEDPQGLGFRMRAAAFVPMALCAAIVAGAVWRGLGALEGRWREAPTARQRTLGLAALAALLVARMPAERDEGVVYAHPAMAAAAASITLPEGVVAIVPERQILFMVAWYTGGRVSLRPEGVPAAQRRRIITLAFIGEGTALDALLRDAREQPGLPPPIGVHPLHPNGLVVIEEPTWEWLLARLPPSERRRAAAWPTI